ncbi:hypothetical protein BH09ACT8_BH09ACT8_14830 [soil metagenome]
MVLLRVAILAIILTPIKQLREQHGHEPAQELDGYANGGPQMASRGTAFRWAAGWGLPGPGIGGWGGPASGLGVLPGVGVGLPGPGLL